jgi:hypothetical protein
MATDKGRVARAERDFLSEMGIDPGTPEAEAALAWYRDTFEYAGIRLEASVDRLGLPARWWMRRRLRRLAKFMDHHRDAAIMRYFRID